MMIKYEAKLPGNERDNQIKLTILSYWMYYASKISTILTNILQLS